MDKTNAMEDALLSFIDGTAAYPFATTLHLALYTTATTEAGGGTEVTGGSYARQPVTFGAVASGIKANNADITFPLATAAWGTVTHAAIFDALAGTMLYHGALQSVQVVAINDVFEVVTGNLTLEER